MITINVGETISFDHTFEVATNIGYLREDNIWVPQYDSLFLVFNGVGKIVTWQLTKGTCFVQVEQVLKDLNVRTELQKCNIDNCCSLCKKYKVLLEMTHQSSSTFSMPFKELFAPFQRGMNVLVNA